MIMNVFDPMPEETEPIIHCGVCDIDIFLVSSTSTTNIRPERQSVDLMRQNNPNFAYKKVKEKAPRELGHVTGWGVIEMAVMFHRDHAHDSSGLNEDSFYFQEPANDNVEYVAIKTLRKKVVENYMKEGGHENPYNEINRMQQLGDNIHILKCVEALEDDEFLYIIMPYCVEGSLMENIPWVFCTSRNAPGYPEHVARELFQQILQILCYLKQHGICHHDISPDNFMFYNGRLVLVDFAMSLRIPQDQFGRLCLIKPQGCFGTFAYQAPEVFMSKGAFGGAGADLWSAAVILYNLCTGHILYYRPWTADIVFRYCLLAGGLSRNPNNNRTAEIVTDTFWHSNDHENQKVLLACVRANACIPSGAMEILEHLLALNPTKRWSLDEALGATWLQNK